eukprot:6682801-Pyramimonas_sp.AAC.1
MPDTDRIDCAAALFRRCARRAMIEAAAADATARASRPERLPRISKEEEIIRASARKLERRGVRWWRVECVVIVADAQLVTLCATQCAGQPRLKSLLSCPFRT